MKHIRFEWDEDKDRANQLKHGISFQEASTVFADENGRFMPDPDHSVDEERFLLMGFSSEARILLVCHCFRTEEMVIRIISARKASRKERAQYEA